ncbi:MAG: hypothetical protein LAO05_07555 [Acidobacteriia bacterium]|nr:hypothetical protein [Terriglobia bacterium]
MRRVIFALVVALVGGFVCAQENPGYTAEDNPFQGEFAFAVGEPVGLHIILQGVRLESLTLTTLAEVRAGEKVKCAIVVAGKNTVDKPASVATALLLEDGDGKALERVVLDPFKAKSGKDFKNKQQGGIAGDALVAARKVYLFFEIAN